MPSEIIRIPENRIAVMIGPEGSTRKEIEKKSNCKLTIDSKTGEIEIECKEAIELHKILDIVKAIGRGFTPEKALYLLDDDYFFRLINLKEILGKNPKRIEQKKARIIGKHGSIREKIEMSSNCFLSIYGNTVAIIGKAEGIESAEKAVTMLIEGANIKSVEDFLIKETHLRKKFKL